MTSSIKVVPTVRDLVVVWGTDVTFEATIEIDTAAIDITTDILEMTVSHKIGGTVKITKNNAVGQHSDPTNGKTKFIFTASDLAPSGEASDNDVHWVYAIRREDSSGKESVHIEGHFTIVPTASIAIP